MKALVALSLGVPFGFAIAWTGMSDPDVIRGMLLLEDWYLYKVFAAAVALGLVGSLLLRRLSPSALVGKERIVWELAAPERRHVTGSLIFGTGWAIAASCPGPIATQLAGGVWWSLFTISGISLGILAFFARQDAEEARRHRTSASAAQAAPPVRP